MIGRAALVLVPGLLLWSGGPAAADAVRDKQQPVLNGLNVPAAWAMTRGAGVTVAVLDSGVDPAQPDLAGSVVEGPDLTEGANPPGVAPQRLHGTNMASIIAGHGHGPGGADGVMGVAPEARILALRVILENSEPGFTTYNTDKRYDRVIADGIRYAADHGAQIINMSLGKPIPTREERQAIAHAVAKGVVVVAAAGNEGASKTAKKNGNAPYSFPASFPGVISVAAVDSEHRHAGFSNENSAVVVSAPGVDIVGAGPGDSYWIGDGTSPATAFVSGVAALIRARHPSLAPALVTQAIITSAAHRPASGYSLAVGFGEVDAAAALRTADTLATTRLNGLGAAPGAPLLPAAPLQVTHHDTRLIVTSALTGLIALAATVATALLAVRRPREEEL
ncbi:S8 family serine peptidase [Actinocorallia longicatena]|uniref:Type VII secretion-associated serine protease mycosin n=1 Tax=Actinocorallia longicatena TaxID=111803 RepID=A0ABP6Q209_9ACTN